MNSFKQKYLINFWDNSRSMIALGILSAVYFGIFGGVWAVTGEMTRWGGEFLELLGMNLDGYSYYQKQNLNGTPLTRTDGIMLIGMFIGCLVAALLANKDPFYDCTWNFKCSVFWDFWWRLGCYWRNDALGW
ncbi:hypothetical protein RC30_07135 [Campylobacter jejuni]|uniref:hypothetical protein n=1 Tax=Campylobacter jejuni TaxID=197 RepID=UPI00073E04DF|nr:hypothetical protein RC30_07135 [Campylobacter jejuni]